MKIEIGQYREMKKPGALKAFLRYVFMTLPEAMQTFNSRTASTLLPENASGGLSRRRS